MAWIIDVDRFAEEGHKPGTNCNAVGLMGPRSYKGNGSDCTAKFRMYTDDNELVYEGRSNKPNSFLPLENFGEPNFGCTRIDYITDGKWATL